MPRNNVIGTERLKISLDPQTKRVLGEIATLGIFGKNEAEVASHLLRDWIWTHREDFREYGIKLVRRKL
jgi:hypothetical protein